MDLDTLPRGRQPNGLYFTVGEINGKLDQMIASILPQFTLLRETDEGFEVRIGELEKWQARILGGGSVILFIITSFEVIRYVLHFK